MSQYCFCQSSLLIAHLHRAFGPPTFLAHPSGPALDFLSGGGGDDEVDSSLMRGTMSRAARELPLSRGDLDDSCNSNRNAV